MAVLQDSQDDSQHGGRLGILAVGSGILTPNFELRRTSMDGGVQVLRSSKPLAVARHQQSIRPFVLTGTQVSWHDSNGRTLIFESSDDGQSANFAQVGYEFNEAFFPG